MNWIKFIFFIVAILMLNEASTEVVELLLIGKGGGWIAFKNISLLIMDLFLGMSILFSIFLSKSYFPKSINWALILLAIVLHAGRSMEYLLSPEIAYCYYPEMFWMNNLKLALLITALGLVYLYDAVKINFNHL